MFYKKKFIFEKIIKKISQSPSFLLNKYIITIISRKNMFKGQILLGAMHPEEFFSVQFTCEVGTYDSSIITCI